MPDQNALQIHNERVKLTATMFNTTGVGCLVGAAINVMFYQTAREPADMILQILAFVMFCAIFHIMGRWILGFLRA